MTRNPIVLSLYDRTGVMVEPWLAAGYECWIVDLQHPRGITRDGRLVKVGADVRLPAVNAAPAPHRDDIHQMTPSDDRGDKRSVTPTGFARAVFEANEPLVRERAA